MHESGVIRRLIQMATAEAARRGATLRGVDVRLGVLAGGSPEHLRAHFEAEVKALGIGPLTINIDNDPDYPGGVELTGIDLQA